MTEDLQHLLDKIQKDGVDKAESEASRIVEEANSKAGDIVSKAKKEADEIIEKAKKDSETFEEKGRKSLEQAARDVVISARAGIQAAVTSVIKTETDAAINDETLSAMLLKVVEAYCSGAGSSEVLVNEADVEKLKGHVLSKLSEEAKSGITIIPEGTISKGFKVVLKDKNIEHDLTDTAITEALSRVLRPHIAAILEKSAQ